MQEINQIDRKVLESVHHLLRDLIVQVEERLFYPKEISLKSIDLDLKNNENPF